MGMYNTVWGHVRCPYCDKINDLEQQIKWTHECNLDDYIVGDKINADDGVYTCGFHDNGFNIHCESCCNGFYYEMTVEDGRLTKISSIDKLTAEGMEKMKLMFKKRNEEQLEYLKKYDC